MKKIILTIILGIFLISLTSAEQQTLGTFKQGECIQLIQTHGNCTYNNITFIYQVNNATLYNISDQMTKVGTFYNYTFCNTSLVGEYIVNGFGNPDGERTSWNYDFWITGTGFEFNQPRALLTLGLFGILIIVFIINIGVIPLLPRDDNKDEEGTLISINKLKYIRPILYVTAWFLLIAIVYSASNLALAYMGSTLLGSILFKIFQVMFALSSPMIVIWFIFIFYNFFQDKKMKEYLDRGWQFDG